LKSSGLDCTKEKSNPDIENNKEKIVKTFTIKDGIRGDLTMPVNFQDTVILKKTGTPTYHFAHVIDDHLMRTTHVIRGEEWLPALPIHIELFEKLSFDLPTYCHTPLLMKIGEEGNKRKLSKRHDPELALSFYKDKGYHPLAVKEYLMTILNSNFEEWRLNNPDLLVEEFPFSLSKMNSSGALFDINKLDDISKNVLVKMPAKEIKKLLLEWAKNRPASVCNCECGHKEPKEILCKYIEESKLNYKNENSNTDNKNIPFESNQCINEYSDMLEIILDIGRTGGKPRKDFVYGQQIFDYISFFFDDSFQVKDEIPEEVSTSDAMKILQKYLETYKQSDSKEEWFAKVKNITSELGYAEKPKDFKKNPDEYKGHIGHVSTVIRIAIAGRSQSPDLWEIQQILGEEKVKERVEFLLI
ncbi:MAG: glutamate--tRNA ligase family protein, partial [Anaerovoracaceae bacterium]